MGSAPLPLHTGALLAGRYRLLRLTNRGGMADVFLARDERTGSDVVVKALAPRSATEDAKAAFVREAELLKKIRHPNVVRLLGYATTGDGLPFLVLEHLPGTELAEVLSKRSLPPPERALDIIKQVARALDAAHRAGIVHRDVKPKNIIIVQRKGEPERVKVIDFGASKLRREPAPALAEKVVGTPEFMSPEQAEGREADVEYRSDLFALATSSYALLTGRVPWRGRDPDEVMDEVAHRPPRPLASEGRWATVQAVLFRALDKSPARRYRSAAAFATALGKAMVADGLLRGRRSHRRVNPR